ALVAPARVQVAVAFVEVDPDGVAVVQVGVVGDGHETSTIRSVQSPLAFLRQPWTTIDQPALRTAPTCSDSAILCTRDATLLPLVTCTAIVSAPRMASRSMNPYRSR